MNQAAPSADAAFAVEAARWIAENFPAFLAGQNPYPYINDAEVAAADPDFQLWLRRVVDRGWGAPTWPVEYGGAGLSARQGKILSEQMARSVRSTRTAVTAR